MELVTGAGISRVSAPGNVPDYNIDLRTGPVGTSGYGFANTIAGSAVNWAESLLPMADQLRYTGDPTLDKTLENIATSTGEPSDKRLAASALLDWARKWLFYSGTTTVAPPPPAVAPGVVAVGSTTPADQLPPLPEGAPTSLGPVVVAEAGTTAPAVAGAATPVAGGDLTEQQVLDSKLTESTKPASSGAGAPAGGLGAKATGSVPTTGTSGGLFGLTWVQLAIGAALALLLLGLLNKRRGG